MPLFMLFTAFSNLFGVGGASLISRCLGAGEQEKARRCTAFCISLMGTVSNTALNHIISTYSNEAVAGMGIAKKLNLLAFAMAQGITQGTLPLIGYCFTSSERNRMARVIRTLAVICAGFALASAALLFFGATPITRFFIDNSETAACGRQFLRTICLAGLTSMLIFFGMTIFQATGKRWRPLVLSLLRKGSVNVPLMVLFNRLFQLIGVAWARPPPSFRRAAPARRRWRARCCAAARPRRSCPAGWPGWRCNQKNSLPDIRQGVFS